MGPSGCLGYESKTGVATLARVKRAGMWVGSFDSAVAPVVGGGTVAGVTTAARRRSKERWMRRRLVRGSTPQGGVAEPGAAGEVLVGLRHTQSEAGLTLIGEVAGAEQAASESALPPTAVEGAIELAAAAAEASAVTKVKKWAPMAGVVGHRGAGVNDGKDISTHGVRENTLRSFREAMAQGMTWFETDVQVTADGVPVIFHDDYILFLDPANGALVHRTIRQLTFAEFKELRGDSIYRKFKVDGPDGAPRPWTCTEDLESMPSLSELLLGLPPHLGFNLELKLPDDDSHPDFVDEHRKFLVDQTLSTLDAIAMTTGARRNIVFSSFDPDAAVYARKAQEHHPVFFLTEAGNHTHANPDPRRLSLQAAVQHALAHGLHGVVTHASAVLHDLSVVRTIRDTGLELATYGTHNSLPGSVAMQLLAGVSSVITDSGRASLAEELTWQLSQGLRGGTVPGSKDVIKPKTISWRKSLPVFGSLVDMDEEGYSSSDESIGDPRTSAEDNGYESDIHSPFASLSFQPAS